LTASRSNAYRYVYKHGGYMGEEHQPQIIETSGCAANRAVEFVRKSFDDGVAAADIPSVIIWCGRCASGGIGVAGTEVKLAVNGAQPIRELSGSRLRDACVDRFQDLPRVFQPKQ
jgi:hypothetical protein